VYAGYDKAGNVGYVADMICTYIFGYPTEYLKINLSGICRSAGDDDFWSVFFGEFFNLVIVKSAGIRVDCILDGIKYFTCYTDFPAVCEVSAVRERQAHNRITRFGQGQICSPVGY